MSISRHNFPSGAFRLGIVFVPTDGDPALASLVSRGGLSATTPLL
jgi:hypothetical protein